MARPRRDRIDRLVALAFGGAAALLPGAVRADDPPKKVYLSKEHLQFNAPLVHGADQTVEVFTILEPGSKALLRYYPQFPLDAECKRPEPGEHEITDAAVASKTTVRSFLPGPDEGTKRRYTTFVGPLAVRVKYCFHLSVVEPVALEDNEKADIKRAVEQSLNAAVDWYVLQSFPHEAACKLKSAAGRAPTMCEIGHEIEKRLGWSGTQLTVSLPGETEPRSLIDGLEALYSRDPVFQAALGSLFVDITAYRDLDVDYRDTYEPFAKRDPGSTPLIYDPLPDVNVTRLVSQAKRLATGLPTALRPRRKELTNWAKGLAAAVAGQSGLDLVTAKTRGIERLPDAFRDPLLARLNASEDEAGNDEMRAFWGLDAAERAKLPFSIDHPTHIDLVGVLAPARGYDVVAPEAKKQRAKYPSAAALNALEDAGVANPTAKSYVVGVGELAEIAEETATDSSGVRFKDLVAALLGDNPSAANASFKAFVGKLQAMRRVETTTDFTWEPDYDTRFPFYATADFGVAAAVFPVRDSPSTGRGKKARGDVIGYFGLNFYFTAVDKNEPLTTVKSLGLTTRVDKRAWRTRGFLRRASVTLGTGITGVSGNDDLGIQGAIVRQAGLAGVGFRLTDYLRLGTGYTFVRQRSRNPLSDRTPLASGIYFSLSLDADVIATVAQWRRKLTL